MEDVEEAIYADKRPLSRKLSNRAVQITAILICGGMYANFMRR